MPSSDVQTSDVSAPKRRPRATPASIVLLALTVALAGASALAYTSTTRADQMRSDLATVAQQLGVSEQDLDSTRGDLSSVRDELDRMRAMLSSEQAESDSLGGEVTALREELSDVLSDKAAADDEVRRLTLQVAGLLDIAETRDACLAAIAEDQAVMARIFAKLQENFNRAAKGSVFAKADVAHVTWLQDVIDNYYEAYARAFLGERTTANAFIDEGNASAQKAANQLAKRNAEIDRMNEITAQVDQDLEALGLQMSVTAQTCASVDTEGTT